jgi:hypothetical protein
MEASPKLTYTSEFHVGSGLYMLSTNSDMPTLSSGKERRKEVSVTNSW